MSYWTEDRKKAERAVVELVRKSQEERHLETKYWDSDRAAAVHHQIRAQAYEWALTIIGRQFDKPLAYRSSITDVIRDLESRLVEEINRANQWRDWCDKAGARADRAEAAAEQARDLLANEIDQADRAENMAVTAERTLLDLGVERKRLLELIKKWEGQLSETVSDMHRWEGY